MLFYIVFFFYLYCYIALLSTVPSSSSWDTGFEVTKIPVNPFRFTNTYNSPYGFDNSQLIYSVPSIVPETQPKRAPPISALSGMPVPFVRSHLTLYIGNIVNPNLTSAFMADFFNAVILERKISKIPTVTNFMLHADKFLGFCEFSSGLIFHFNLSSRTSCC
jgi:hypothetical protein